MLLSSRLELIQDLVHLLDFFEERPCTDGADGGQSESPNVDALFLHEPEDSVHSMRKGVIRPLIGALHPTRHDDDPVDAFPEAIQVETFGKHDRGPHPQNVSIGRIGGVRLAHGIGTRISTAFGG